MSMKNYAAETAFISIRQLSQMFGSEKTNEAFAVIAEKLTNALKLIPGCENYEVHYRNILNRDENPDGYRAFFRITTYDPKSELNLMEANPEVGLDMSKAVELFIAKE